MAKKLVKIITMGVLIIMSLGLFAGCNDDYVYNENDFKLTVEVDNTAVQVGDTITITAKFENLSGQDIRVQAGSPSVKKLEDILMVMCLEDNLDGEFSIDDLGGAIPKRTFKKGSAITKSIMVTVENSTDYMASAAVVFSVGKEYNRIWIISEQTLIKTGVN